MTTNIKTIQQLQSEMISNPLLQDEFKENPVAALQKMQPSPLENDNWIYRIIVSALGLSILSIIIGVIVLIAVGKVTNDQSVPTILTAIGSAAIGGLAGLLAPQPKNK